jgi:hypothetical protein
MDLTHRLTEMGATLTDAERSNLKLLLGMAAGGLIGDDGRPPTMGVAGAAFDATANCIARLQPHRHRVPSNSVIYRGRPNFVTDGLLDELRAESRQMRARAERFDDHYVTSGAPLARSVGYSTELNDLIGTYTEHVRPTAKANYLYYDEVGLGIEPHVDNEAFSLNAIMMLNHEWEGDPSALVLYPPNRSPERVLLAPGEMIVLFADSIAHARERVGPNERISIVAFGFQSVL